ncbi:MAG: TIGR01777 family protein [Taibaiella sp.]|nr:TIGR01777 family protein [Taibaiella sp.]
MKVIGITGGTGFIGHHLVKLLTENNFYVVIFSRNKKEKNNKDNVTYAYWDPAREECDLPALQKLDAIVHLAGAGVADKRWTDERKKEIVDSRVKTTAFIIGMLQKHAPNCKTFIGASATGWYGPDRPDTAPFEESTPSYKDFLGNTCRLWEEEEGKAAVFSRLVILRFGIVLGKESGAFPKFAQPTSFGVLPILASGKQVISWIHVDDLCSMILYTLNNTGIKGIYNAVAPKPVTDAQLMATIARVKGGLKIPVHVPAFVLKAMLGEMSIEVLKSCTVSAKKITASGFSFQYADIESAVKDILSR